MTRGRRLVLTILVAVGVLILAAQIVQDPVALWVVAFIAAAITWVATWPRAGNRR